ncbi:hypothetical protein H5398_16660 [Tessaracoccus sp. MC1679]|uniref:hypothetical protein n=1 Tax=Tessaracoccus sp. MC1679 TaxID=2760313 RepID=UPI001603F2C2|nr:hypothetical protein [Tessaracoccus sp. MC1679]MBB1517583.1 hypothetical protein [Tessaracoccus sp. MC1679]
MPQLGFPTLGVQAKEFLVQTILEPHGSQPRAAGVEFVSAMRVPRRSRDAVHHHHERTM